MCNYQLKQNAINTSVRLCTGLHPPTPTPRHPQLCRQLYSDLLQVEQKVFDGWKSQSSVPTASTDRTCSVRSSHRQCQNREAVHFLGQLLPT